MFSTSAASAASLFIYPYSGDADASTAERKNGGSQAPAVGRAIKSYIIKKHELEIEQLHEYIYIFS